jgi:hypothetical protein
MKISFPDLYLPAFLFALAISQIFLLSYYPSSEVARISAYILMAGMVFTIYWQIIDVRRSKEKIKELKIPMLRVEHKVPSYIPNTQVGKYIKAKERKRRQL